MLSSTSSSDSKVLRADWGRTWAVTAALLLLMLGGWETFWRARGFKPAVIDDTGLWASARHRVRPDSTVLVGSSLTDAAVVPSVLAEVSGTQVVQLAVNGGRTFLLLQNLARDPTFRGTVICELVENEIVDEKQTSWEKDLIHAYKQETLARRGETFLQRFMQEHLAFTTPQLSLRTLVDDAFNGRVSLAFYPHYSIGIDRTLYADFAKADVGTLRARIDAVTYSPQPVVTPEEFVARAHRFEVLAEEIERRGGRVIFFRPPFSGVVWERTENTYPKAAYWDEFARRTRFRTIHFKDYPGLQIECPDYAHLDMRDAPRFTEALANIIIRNGWLCCKN